MWIKKKTFDGMLEDIKNKNTQIEILESDFRNLKHSKHVEFLEHDAEMSKLYDENLELNERLEKTEALYTKSDSIEVILRIGDDLTTITPVIRWKETTPEKLIEIGAITDVQNSKIAVQVALMALAAEAIQDIMNNFEEPVGDDH